MSERSEPARAAESGKPMSERSEPARAAESGKPMSERSEPARAAESGNRLSTVNRRLKRWPGWLALGLVVFALLAVGVSRDSGPQTQQDRIDAIGKRLACPTCDGESVYVSRAAAAEAIRNEIARQVGTGERSDDEVVSYIEERFGGQVLLVPRATGLDALVWVLPVVVLVIAVAGLAVAFRRWQREPDLVPSDEDRALVEAALAGEHSDGDGKRR